MSHTSPRFRRLIAGLAVAAATTATTLLGATPAYAAGAATAFVDGKSLVIDGSVGQDRITATASNGTIQLQGDTTLIDGGPGCTDTGRQSVSCTGVTKIEFFGLKGDDRFENKTSLRSKQVGGLDKDELIGGSGFDTCIGEITSGCEA